MDYYVDIEVLPFEEFSEGILMSTVFGCFHKVLVRSGCGRVGVSFPRHGVALGNVLRIHGTLEELERVNNSTEWMGLRDYVRATTVSKVPNKVMYRRVQRRQARSSAERLRRRAIRNGRLSEDEAQTMIPDSKEQRLSLPFVTLKSASTGKVFRLFIDHGEKLSEPIEGHFSAYGLSQSATVPWF